MDVYDIEDLPTASIKEVSEGTENISESKPTATSTPSHSTTKTKLNLIPRREVQWRLGMDAGNRNLGSIARRFGDYLDCFLSSSSDPPLRRIKTSKEAYSKPQTSHLCPGYLREEIRLTTDVARSAIISHECPSQSRRCSLCSQNVQYQVPQSELLQPGHTWSHAPQVVSIDHEIIQIPYRDFLRLQTELGLNDKHLGNMSVNEKVCHKFSHFHFRYL